MYTASQIITDALQIAKCPGYTSQGGRALNYVLRDLSQNRNLKISLLTETLNLPAYSNGPLTLDLKYLRTYDLFYLVNGEPYFLNPCSLKQYDAEVQQPAISNYPYEWATDLAQVATGGAGLMYVYPQPNAATVLTHRYYQRHDDIATPETSSVVPWFQDQDYLVSAVAARMMRITDDARYPLFVTDCDRMLEKHLLTEGDEQQVVKEVQLDPRRFKVAGGSKPTKTMPW